MQVITWYAYYYSRFPQGNAFARIAFPYNPSPEKSFWEGVIGYGFPLERDNEGWVGNQFWDFCSGIDDTYSIIEQSFTTIRIKRIIEKEINTLLGN